MLIGRRYLKQFWIVTVFGICSRCTTQSHAPLPPSLPPPPVSQLGRPPCSPTSDDARNRPGRHEGDALPLDRASRRSELFGNRGRGPRYHSETRRTDWAKQTSESSLSRQLACLVWVPRRGRLVLHVRAIPLRRLTLDAPCSRGKGEASASVLRWATVRGESWS